MPGVRSAAVAGTFYPADAETLRADVEGMLAAASDVPAAPLAPSSGAPAAPLAPSPDTPAPLRPSPHRRTAAVPAGPARAAPAAVIAPHAGYVYSGPIAASAFAALQAVAPAFGRVVVVGPSHYVSFRGIALPDADLMATPLGMVAVDGDGRAVADRFPQVVVSAPAHRREHSLEVEIPFLQVALDSFTIVPLVTGSATPEEVAEVVDALWDERTLVVVSSDLSHYHDYDTARRLDEATAAAIVGRRAGDLDAGSACGRLAIQGLLLVASARRLDVSLLDLRSSGDTAGPRDEVVGYGAFRVA